MEGGTEDRKTRSGKKLSSTYSKRKRVESDEESPQSKKKMPDTVAEQIAGLRAFFSEELRTNKEEIKASNMEAIGALTKWVD